MGICASVDGVKYSHYEELKLQYHYRSGEAWHCVIAKVNPFCKKKLSGYLIIPNNYLNKARKQVFKSSQSIIL